MMVTGRRVSGVLGCMGGWVDGWMGGWVGSGWVDGWGVDGWMGGEWMGGWVSASPPGRGRGGLFGYRVPGMRLYLTPNT
ncbi:hypothetical protein E1H13_22240 [Nodosilinea sp. P-1105]|nr:hypothetical protein [Nodosilinea sp. P-1105]